MVEGFCVNCETTNTPMWRAGPAGPKSLCNACGLRWKKGVLKLEDAGKKKAGSDSESTKKKTVTAPAVVKNQREKRTSIPTSKVVEGRVAKRSRNSSKVDEKVLARFAPEVKSKKIYVDFERYECLFSGLMVVNKFKQVV